VTFKLSDPPLRIIFVERSPSSVLNVVDKEVTINSVLGVKGRSKEGDDEDERSNVIG
jgi:hypothetical protein